MVSACARQLVLSPLYATVSSRAVCKNVMEVATKLSPFLFSMYVCRVDHGEMNAGEIRGKVRRLRSRSTVGIYP